MGVAHGALDAARLPFRHLDAIDRFVDLSCDPAAKRPASGMFAHGGRPLDDRHVAGYSGTRDRTSISTFRAWCPAG